LSAGLFVAVGGAFVERPAAAAAPVAAQDRSYLSGIEQVNLTEIALGSRALALPDTDAITALAQMTVTDHEAARHKALALARALDVSLPTTAAPAQQQAIVTLDQATGAQFVLPYLQAQVAGHEAAIKATEAEINGGSAPGVIAFARAFLPVAERHLAMAQQDLDVVGGNPSSVPAGSGGQAATDSTSGWPPPMLLFGVGASLLLVGLAVVLVGRARVRRWLYRLRTVTPG
jgi:putative membrane protein